MLLLRAEIQITLEFKRAPAVAQFLRKLLARINRITRGYLYDADQLIFWLESRGYKTYAEKLTAYVEGDRDDA